MKNEQSALEEFDRVWGQAFPNPVGTAIEGEPGVNFSRV